MVSTLWRFASDCYQRPGVAEICLHAQDAYAADVNMLLAAAWLAVEGIRWEEMDVISLSGLCTEWRAQCLFPLRAVRRYLKHKTGADDMYSRVKALELEAERHQLHLMESVLHELEPPATVRPGALHHNLRIYLNALPNSDRLDSELIDRIAGAITATPANPPNNPT